MGVDRHSRSWKDAVPVTAQPLAAVVMRSSPPCEVIPGVMFSVMLEIITTRRRRCYFNGSGAASWHYRKLWRGLVRRHPSRVVKCLCCFCVLHQLSRDYGFPKSEPALVTGLSLLLPHCVRRLGRFSWPPLPLYFPWKKGLRSLNEKACTGYLT